MTYQTGYYAYLGLSSQTTVVPALGDSWREWPPAVSSHIINVPTHFNVKLPEIGGHLPNADSIYWLSVPAITDSVNKCRVFDVHFNQKSLARTLTCDRHFAQIPVLSSGDHRQYFISRVKALPHVTISSTISWRCTCWTLKNHRRQYRYVSHGLNCLHHEPCDYGKSTNNHWVNRHSFYDVTS